MDNTYHPIDCAVHDVLESLATRRRQCTVVYRDADDRTVDVDAIIVDVYTEGKAEYIRLDNGLVIRLDRLVSVDGVAVVRSC